MKYGIFSDIHGNLAALNQVLARLHELDCDRLVCLGDVVGYGPFPNECCEVVQQKADICLVGNHDYAAIGKMETDYFNQYARSALQWTAKTLTQENKQFLAGLPFDVRENDILFVHASPHEPQEWNYVLSLYDAEENFKEFTDKVCFIGHSHVAVVYSYEDGEFPTIESAKTLRLFDGFRFIINVGSVGQPRDRDPRASFAVYNEESKKFELQRIEYDVSSTQNAMKERDLPQFLIDRLEMGR